ncbi:hypothetical protein CROQUDRAFT_111255 [Cronartium quercuum f. sp. fusiforme G11]|uniref:Uncharacterized protein n=1 Tax=Cronartium quercuum f. sp. fusiforme G11 TaxID=708437 RepID=A0A9P6N9G1_9BASI|nr:hypothetical protein CROQUDRAFT_111255 [Cronartium quercuum f. sp. fusiforme G11]
MPFEMLWMNDPVDYSTVISFTFVVSGPQSLSAPLIPGRLITLKAGASSFFALRSYVSPLHVRPSALVHNHQSLFDSHIYRADLSSIAGKSGLEAWEMKAEEVTSLVSPSDKVDSHPTVRRRRDRIGQETYVDSLIGTSCGKGI